MEITVKKLFGALTVAGLALVFSWLSYVGQWQYAAQGTFPPAPPEMAHVG